MKIKIIDFGLPENHRPLRSHANDAGADVYMPFDCTLEPGGIAKIPLGFGLEVPDGYAAYVFPRSSLAAKGVVCELPPVDSGYRGEIPAEYMEQAEQGLLREIEKAIADGYTYFISGFADGADQLFAGIVLEKAKENPVLHLEAAIPYRNRYKRLMEDERTRGMLEACTKVEVISEEWASNVYMKRNRYMVGQADRVIAVYDGREKGGTVSTIRMVHAQRKEMREVPVGSYLPESMINLGYFRNASGR